MQRIFITCLAILISNSVRLKTTTNLRELQLRNDFSKFQSEKGRSCKSLSEYKERFDAYKHTVDEVEKANAKRTTPKSAYFQVNEYADWTAEELH